MELLGGWDRVRRNLVGTFFLQARAENLEKEFTQPDRIILKEQTYSADTTPIIVLEREYRKFQKLEDSLEEARQEYADKKKEFQLRWQLCSERNEMLKNFITSFYQYYEISQLKQESIIHLQSKYNYELYEKRREVNRLKKELAKLKEVKIELNKRLDVNLAYKHFMNSVVKESKGKYEDIEHVMSRYNELLNIRRTHVEKTVNQVEKAFQLEKELREIQQEIKFKEVAGKTYISELDEYHSRLQVSSWRRHDNLLAIKSGLKRELLKTYMPQKAIHNLYLLLCQEMNQTPKLKPNQFQEQLQFIQKFLKELKKIAYTTKQSLESPSDVPLLSAKSFRGKSVSTKK